MPVRRIVRQDSSGTTYGWKAYLALIRPDRNWLGETYGATNTSWPAAGGSGVGTVTRRGQTARLARRPATASARRPTEAADTLARLVASTDGSIGYVDLATARSNGFDITAGANAGLHVLGPARGDIGARRPAPTRSRRSPRSRTSAGADKGASCGTATVTNAPTVAGSPKGDPTLGDWSGAYAAGGEAYPACVLTYALAWDDNAPVYGTTAAEEAKARTVKDYLRLVVSDGGQSYLLSSDYSALPERRPASRSTAGRRPASTRSTGTRRPATTRPAGAQPAGAEPAGAEPAGAEPAGPDEAEQRLLDPVEQDLPDADHLHGAAAGRRLAEGRRDHEGRQEDGQGRLRLRQPARAPAE